MDAMSTFTETAQPTTLLHITASPRRESLSTSVSRELVSSWQAANPGARVIHRDVAAVPVPPITEAWTEICDNLMRDQITDVERLHEGVRTAGQQRAWDVLEPLLTELLEASLVVLATPMYNYSVPASLKAWLDQVTFPRMNLSPREFAVVATRGGSYGAGSAKAGVEHQTRYLSDFVRGHFGVQEPATFTVDLGNARVDPLLADAFADHLDSFDTAVRDARAFGRRHGERTVVA
jgi:FMN-dependent NADH-azoreductase